MNRITDTAALLCYTVAALIVATGLCAATLAKDLYSGLRRIWSSP